MTVRFRSVLDSGYDFTTDTNAFQRMGRTYAATRSIQGNMYPVVGTVGIRDISMDMSLAVSTDHPIAATGVNGDLEMLMHRRLHDIDLRGNDHNVLETTQLLLFGQSSQVENSRDTFAQVFTRKGSCVLRVSSLYLNCSLIINSFFPSMARA